MRAEENVETYVYFELLSSLIYNSRRLIGKMARSSNNWIQISTVIYYQIIIFQPQTIHSAYFKSL